MTIDPWYRCSLDSMPADFDAAAPLARPAPPAAPGSAWDRIGSLAGGL